VRLTELAGCESGYRVGPRSVAREIGESEETVEQALDSLVTQGKVQVFIYQGQDWWGVK